MLYYVHILYCVSERVTVHLVSGTFLNTLKFQVKDCDPTTGEPDSDVGYADEYVVRCHVALAFVYMKLKPLKEQCFIGNALQIFIAFCIITPYLKANGALEDN